MAGIEIVRPVRVDAALAAELNRLFDEGMVWDEAQGVRFLADPDNLLLVARCEGRACGFVSAHRLQRFDARRAEVLLYEIDVAPAFQRRGIGRALIAGVTAWAREVGADEVWVLTEADNAAGMGLYAATGGELGGEWTRMFTYRIEESGRGAS